LSSATWQNSGSKICALFGSTTKSAKTKLNLALFDFDGTITSKDSFAPFVQASAKPSRALAGRILLLPLIVAYRAGVISASATRSRVCAFGFRGRSEAEIRNAGVTFATERLPGTIRAHALERIRWHREQKDLVVVVSAALDVYLKPWCDSHGLDVICTELDSVNGILTGKYRGGDCVGREKARRIVSRYDLSSFEIVFAYGDTTEDADMLALAHRRFFRWQEISEPLGRRWRGDHVDQAGQ